MKKQLQKGLILGMIFLSGNAFGQTNELAEKGEGYKAAPSTYLRLLLNMVNTSLDNGHANGDLWDHQTSHRGLQAGVSFQAGISSRVSLLSELYFMTKGGQLRAEDPQTGSNAALRFYTMELPVLARVHIGKFHINAGPALAYNLSGKRKMEGSSAALSFNNSSNGFRRLDAGIQVGGGYRFKIKQKRLALDIRYSHGLSNISRSQEVYNRFLNISLQVINPWKINPLGRKEKSR